MKHPIQITRLPTEDSTDILMSAAKVFTNKGPLHREFYGDAWLDRGDKYQHIYVTVSQDVEPIKEGDWTYDTLNNCIEQVNKSTVDMINAGMLHNGNRKIIATTDPKLKGKVTYDGIDERWIPIHTPHFMGKVQQSFLKEYCSNPDGEYEVEYGEFYLRGIDCPNCELGLLIETKGKIYCEDCHTGPHDIERYKGFRLKLNQDNTINITSVEQKMYTKEEVEIFSEKVFRKGINEGYLNYPALYTKRLDKDWIKDNLQL